MTKKEEYSRRGRAAKAKGKTYERDVAKFLSEIFPAAARGRSQSVHDSTYRPDVDGTPFWVETKSRKLTNPRAALIQAETEACEVNDSRPAVAFCKDAPVGGGKVEWVIMRPSTFMMIIKKAFLGEEYIPQETPQAKPQVDTKGNTSTFTSILRRRKIYRSKRTKES